MRIPNSLHRRFFRSSRLSPLFLMPCSETIGHHVHTLQWHRFILSGTFSLATLASSRTAHGEYGRSNKRIDFQFVYCSRKIFRSLQLNQVPLRSGPGLRWSRPLPAHAKPRARSGRKSQTRVTPDASTSNTPVQLRWRLTTRVSELIRMRVRRGGKRCSSLQIGVICMRLFTIDTSIY